MMIGHRNNTVQEQHAAYTAAVAKQDHALVRELWTVEGQSDRFHVQELYHHFICHVAAPSAKPLCLGEGGKQTFICLFDRYRL